MRNILIAVVLFLLAVGSAGAQTDCDVWLGTWDVVNKDESSCVWVIDEIITGTSTNIPCQAVGTSTPTGGGEPVDIQVFKVTFFPSFIYTEDKKLGEGMKTQDLQINEVGDAFVSGTTFTSYNIASGTKRLSGPRCGGVDPPFVLAGAMDVMVTITGNESSFDPATTLVTLECPEIELLNAEVISATEIQLILAVEDNVIDKNCSVVVLTGDEEVACNLAIRGVGDPALLEWVYETGGIVSSSPTVDGGRVYFGSGDGNVYCLDAQTGQKIWSFATGNAINSSPAVAGGYVYIGSNDFNVYCLNAATGSKVWEYTTGNAVQSSPALYGGYVYIGSYDNKIYCLDAATGAKIWDVETAENVFSTPAVADGRVYVGGVDFILYCLDAITGESLWQYATDGDIPPSPAVADGRVYFGSKDFSFYCLDAVSGQKLWDFQTGDIVFNSPAVYEGFVYFGSLDKKVYCLNAESGSLAWQFTAGDVIQSSPAVTDDYVYIGSGDTNVYCLVSGTGKKIWNFKTGDTVVSSAAVADGRIYIGSFDNNLYCLKAPQDEKENWPMFRNNLQRTGTPFNEGCLAATALGASSQEADTLRRFRDEILSKSSAGNRMIQLYYAYEEKLQPLCASNTACAFALQSTLKTVMPLVEGMLATGK